METDKLETEAERKERGDIDELIFCEQAQWFISDR